MAYGSIISRIPSREYVQELQRLLDERDIIQVPEKYHFLADQFFYEAAQILKSVYLSPSIGRPSYTKKRVRTQAELKAEFLKYVRVKVFDQLVEQKWIKEDERTKLILVTEKAQTSMESLAEEILTRNNNSANSPVE